MLQSVICRNNNSTVWGEDPLPFSHKFDCRRRLSAPEELEMQEKLTANSQSSFLLCFCVAGTSKVNLRQICSLQGILEIFCRQFDLRALVSGSPGGVCTHIPGLPGAGLSNRSFGARVTLVGCLLHPLSQFRCILAGPVQNRVLSTRGAVFVQPCSAAAFLCI